MLWQQPPAQVHKTLAILPSAKASPHPPPRPFRHRGQVCCSVRRSHASAGVYCVRNAVATASQTHVLPARARTSPSELPERAPSSHSPQRSSASISRSAPRALHHRLCTESPP